MCRPAKMSACWSGGAPSASHIIPFRPDPSLHSSWSLSQSAGIGQNRLGGPFPNSFEYFLNVSEYRSVWFWSSDLGSWQIISFTRRMQSWWYICGKSNKACHTWSTYQLGDSWAPQLAAFVLTRLVGGSAASLGAAVSPFNAFKMKKRLASISSSSKDALESMWTESAFWEQLISPVLITWQLDHLGSAKTETFPRPQLWPTLKLLRLESLQLWSLYLHREWRVGWKELGLPLLLAQHSK